MHLNLSFKTVSGVFDTTKKKSKEYFALLISIKALSPCNGQKLKCEFDLSDDELKQAFSLPHSIAFEPYVKAFQYKGLNSILYTNYKLQVTLKAILAPFVNLNLKHCTNFFSTALMFDYFGMNLSLIT